MERTVDPFPLSCNIGSSATSMNLSIIESVAVEKKDVGRFSLRNIMRYAAIGLLVICAGLGGHLLTRYSRSVGVEKDYLVFAAKGQKASVVLPDGSKVWLNSDSEIIGLILFVYSVGLQVGPGFFSAFKKGVLKRNHIDNFYQLWTKSLKVPKTMFVLVMVLMTNMFKKCCLNMPKRERQKY